MEGKGLDEEAEDVHVARTGSMGHVRNQIGNKEDATMKYFARTALCLVLSFVMAFGTLFTEIAPMAVFAAENNGGEGGFRISSPSNGSTVNGMADTTVRWNRYSGTDHYYIVVKDVVNGKTELEEEVSSSKTSYSIGYEDVVFWRKNRQYKIYVAAMDASGNVLNGKAAWHAIYVTNVMKLDQPEFVDLEEENEHDSSEDLYIEWWDVENANHYNVYFKQLNGEPDPGNDEEDGTNLSFTRVNEYEIKVPSSKLAADTWYKIAVGAENTYEDVASDYAIAYIKTKPSSRITASESAMEIGSTKGNTASFYVYTDVDFDISCNKSWLDWDIQRINSSTSRVTLKVVETNPYITTRSCVVKAFADGAKSAYIRVEQLVVKASAPDFYNISVPSSVTVGETIEISGEIESDSSPLKVVSIEVSESSRGYYPFRNASVGSDVFDLSDIFTKSSDGLTVYGGIKTGVHASGYVGTSYTWYDDAFDFTVPGTYTVAIRAQNEAGLIGESIHTVQVKKDTQITAVNALEASKDTVCVGVKFEFTATTTPNAQGMVLFVKENGNIFNIGGSTMPESQTSQRKKFVFEYAFNSTGLVQSGVSYPNTRRVYAYPIDQNGNVIEDDAVCAYCDITVTPAEYELGAFTVYDAQAAYGEGASIHWSAASSQNGAAVSYNVYISTGVSTILLTEQKIGATSYEVNSAIIRDLGIGTYPILVIATAANHSQLQETAVLTVMGEQASEDMQKPMINPFRYSASPIFCGTATTFSTEASDETALERLELYMDGALVKTVPASGTSAGISYTTDSLEKGNHTITAKAYDKAGNFNAWSEVFEVTESMQGVVGDVNSDGRVTNYDRYLLNRYLNNLNDEFTVIIDKTAADIDGDGYITADDCTILTRYLAGWIGYDDLTVFYMGPSTPPTIDTSKWKMGFTSNAVSIELEVVDGEIDPGKNYLFVAEDAAGLHYSGVIDAGKTAASFSVTSLQMPRGESYSYYVLPEGIALAGNKEKYCIGKSVLPLFNGNMITSVKSADRTVAKNGNIFIDDNVKIGWDGSFGVNHFQLIVTVNGKEIYNKTFLHDGPGSVVIDASSIASAGTGKIVIAGYVKPSESSGLATAVSTWSGNVIEREVINDLEDDPTVLLNDRAKALYAKNEAAGYLQIDKYYYYQAFSDELTGWAHWGSIAQNARAYISNVVNGIFTSPSTLFAETTPKALIKQTVRTKLLEIIGDEDQLKQDLENVFDLTTASEPLKYLDLQSLSKGGTVLSNEDIATIVTKIDFRSFNQAKDGAAYKKVFENMSVYLGNKSYQMTEIFNINESNSMVLKQSLQTIDKSTGKDQIEMIKRLKGNVSVSPLTLKKAFNVDVFDGLNIAGDVLIQIDDMRALWALNKKFDELEKELMAIEGASIGVFKECIAETIEELRRDALGQVVLESAGFVVKEAVDHVYGNVVGYCAKNLHPLVAFTVISNGIITSLANTDTINKGQLALPHIVDAMNDTKSQIMYTYSLFMAYPSNELYAELETLFLTYKFQVELGAEVYLNINKADYNSYLKRFVRFVNPYDNEDTMSKEVQSCYDADIRSLNYVLNWFGMSE